MGQWYSDFTRRSFRCWAHELFCQSLPWRMRCKILEEAWISEWPLKAELSPKTTQFNAIRIIRNEIHLLYSHAVLFWSPHYEILYYSELRPILFHAYMYQIFKEIFTNIIPWKISIFSQTICNFMTYYV